MTFAQNQDTKIFYQAHGQGEPLIMIMGLGGTSDAWALQFQVLSAKYRCIALDNRGAGRSDMPDEPYSMETFAADVAAVMDAEGIASAHIMGVSMGGLIAQEFYHQYPERVRSLILGCTGVGAGDPEYIWPEQKILDVLTMEREHSAEPAFVAEYIKIFYDHEFIEKTPNLAEFIIATRNKMPQPVYANQRQLAACIEHTPNSPRLKDISVPTLILHGENDQIWPLANAQYLADHIPGAEYKVISHSAHMFFVEQPQDYNQAILDFLGRNS